MDRGGQPLNGPSPFARRWLVAVPLAFLGVLFVYPLFRILAVSFAGDTGVGAAFVEVFSTGSLRGAAWFTIWQSLASTALTLLVAFPAAALVGRYGFAGRRLLLAAVSVPFVMPTVVVGAAFLALLGPEGALGVDLRRTAWAILIAHVFYNYAVVVRTVGGYWATLDPRLEEAATALGASRLAVFRHVTLPMLRPAIAAAASIVFVFTFTSFGVVLLLGGFGFATIEVMVFREATINLDLAVAGALALLQMIGVGAALAAYGRIGRRRAVRRAIRTNPARLRSITTAGQRVYAAAVIGTSVVLLGVPLAQLVTRAFRAGGTFGLEHFASLADADRSAVGISAWEATLNSLEIAVIATVISLVIGLISALAIAQRETRAGAAIDTLVMLPLGTSAVTIGFGFLVAFDAPIDLRTSPLLIPLAHSLIAVPFVVRITLPVLRSIRASLREAATVLGASPGRVLREIDLPIVSRAALLGAGFAFAISLGEFGATAFLIRPDRPTMTTTIFRLLGRPGEATFGRAMAMSVILMLVTGAVILGIDRLRDGEVGEF